MNIKRTIPFLVSLIMSLLIASCGGGSSQVAGIGGTGITSSGTITGFGSIFVNGVEYDTDDPNINVTINGTTGKMATDLKLGMVVTVRGSLDSTDTTQGTASTITVDSELEGPIAATPVFDANTDTRSFVVLGRNVLATPSTFYDGGITYATMSKDDVVEVHGYLDGSGIMHATRIEKKGTVILGSSTVEAKGTVTILTASSFTLNVGSNTLTINHNSSTDYSGIGGVGALTNGLAVEVKGTLNTSNEIAAIEIELSDSLFDSTDSSVELEGIITSYVDDTNFSVNGQAVDASGVTIPSNLTLANGVQIEVEGTYSSASNKLVATKIEGRDSDIKIKAKIATSINPTTKAITLALGSGTIVVIINNTSQLEDETNATSACANAIFCITDLIIGDYLEVEATIDGNGAYIVKDLKRKTPKLENKVKGKATLKDATTGAEILTILGVDFSTDSNTSFKINDVTKTRTEFFAAFTAGATVEMKEVYTIGTGPTGTATELDLKM